MKQKVLDRFLRYVCIDTQSDEKSTSLPSTRNQFELANLLVKELFELGINDVYVNDSCYVFGTVPSNCQVSQPVIALIAHLDTSPDISGQNVKPQVIENYTGGDIPLPGNPSLSIAVSDNHHLTESIGHTIVTTDGTTLLGSDDKAGVAAIMATVEYLVNHPEIQHGEIRVCFTPDEETGNGLSNFDTKELHADFGYTIDGGFTGELNNETFSADSAKIVITGVDMHPGYAKNKMINSAKAAAYILCRLPDHISPEHTCNYESYIHPVNIQGCVSESTINLILRDFDDDGLMKLHKFLDDLVDETKRRFIGIKIGILYKSTYKNMAETLKTNPHITERLENAVLKTGITPKWIPIRGGTDGSKLTAMGIPTPNIFTASCNSHSLTEWQSIDGLVKAVETLVNLVAIEDPER